MTFNDLPIYADAGRRAGKASRNRDWSLAQHEWTWLNRALSLEPEHYRKEARRVFDDAYLSESLTT